MLTETDWQHTLDTCDPAERSALLLIFADWLEDRGNRRAKGYRALGINGRCPMPSDRYGRLEWRCYGDGEMTDDPASLPADWWEELAGELPATPTTVLREYLEYDSRREMDNAAAKSFARLPLARQHSLLTVPA